MLFVFQPILYRIQWYRFPTSATPFIGSSNYTEIRRRGRVADSDCADFDTEEPDSIWVNPVEPIDGGAMLGIERLRNPYHVFSFNSGCIRKQLA